MFDLNIFNEFFENTKSYFSKELRLFFFFYFKNQYIFLNLTMKSLGNPFLSNTYMNNVILTSLIQSYNF